MDASIEENHSFKRRSNSPDIFGSFSEDEGKVCPDDIIEDEEMPMAKEDCDGNKVSNSDWKGIPLEELPQSFSSLTLFPNVHVSISHSVLFQVPVKQGQVPKPYLATPHDKWDQDHVRMPNSSQSLYPVQEADDEKGLRLRWELVQEALLRSIMNSHQLEAAILSFNSRYNEKWNFVALHSFFNNVLEEDETELFFRDILPQMINLALQLPELVTAPIPLLRKHRSHSVSISQLQVASLLANAFFCTFPRRNSTKKGSEYSAYPDINFNRLFQCADSDDDHSVVGEKLKCIISYFRRVCKSVPQGVLTFSRRYMHHDSLPNWEKSKTLLPKIYISSKGYIEDDGSGMLQVDFANKFVGGGVLGWGCVQEEIRFLICPELLLSRLFTECLDSTEILLIIGSERFSNYSGYGSSFKWTGDHHDKTPFDQAGRRHCSIVAMDALYFSNPSNQYTISNLTREINKAYVGFYEPDHPDGSPLSAVATGNWGCGAFRGDANLKALLQLMAAAETGRSLAYFTFGDHHLRDRIFRMYRFLVENGVSIGRLWNLLCQYSRLADSAQRVKPDLYKYLYAAVLKPNFPEETPSQSSIKGFFPKKPSKVTSKESDKIKSSTTAASCNVNLSELGLSAEDLEAVIEEFDSDVEEDQGRICNHDQQEPPLRTEKQKELQTETNKQRDEGIPKGHLNECKGKPPPSSASKSMSCLSLIEESLGVCPSKKKVENHQNIMPADSGPSYSASSSTSSLLSSQCTEPLTLEGQSSNNKPESENSNLSVVSINTPSNSKVVIENAGLTPARSSGTKRKISDYFNVTSS